MVVIEDDHMIQALATNASDHALDIGILPRTPWCNVNLFDAHSFDSQCEGIAVDSVAVPNHKPGSAVFRKCFDDLLCGPNRCRMLRDIEVDDAASIVRQDNEDIEDLQANRGDCEEINGYHLLNMISKKGRPGLSRLAVLVRYQSRNRPLGNLIPEFQQFSMDARGSPDGIGASQVRTNLRISESTRGRPGPFD